MQHKLKYILTYRAMGKQSTIRQTHFTMVSI